MGKELTAEQWQAIAEKLAKYIDEMCAAIDHCDGCPFEYDGDHCEFMFGIRKAKKELGYE